MGPSTIWNTRMRTFLFLYILSINFCQATGYGNSTQMLYAKLIIDYNAIQYITGKLNPFVVNTSLYIETPVMTTECMPTTNNKICHCRQGYIWNDTLCRSNPACCGNMNCSLGTSVDAMCVLNTTVTITGSLKLPAEKYQDCLQRAGSPLYIQCSGGLLTTMKRVFSTLRGFDYLIINGFRLGSIITDFVMSIASTVDSQSLINSSVAMASELSASLDMQTSGVVYLIMPTMPVAYGASNQVIKCKAVQDLNAIPQWSIINTIGNYNITNGTISTVNILSSTESIITLTNVTDLWAGQYLCLYHQYNNCNGNCSINIYHKGIAQMDVALKPNIAVFTEASFPRCTKDQPILEVTARCEIMNSSEPYNVSWSGDNLKDEALQIDSSNTLVYTVKKVINCNACNGTQVVCTFKNRLGQETNGSVPINIIAVTDIYCPAQGDWEDTKAGFTAVLKCKNAAGLRQRNCDSSAHWHDEQSGCVNPNLYSVLQNAIISDTGLGLLDQNAQNIFSNLQNATQTPVTINTFANVNTSVVILSTMSDKLKMISNTITIDALMASCSNLLDQSLGNSWITPKSNSNITLAENYLRSLENLISISNITNNSSNPNLQVDACNDTTCSNSVFNAQVTVTSSGNGSIKTAGFQNLQNYLPNTTDNFVINSIIVLTTTNREKEDLEITITFPLLRNRLSDFELQCVSWNYNKSQWSTDGCKWGGASNPGACTCSHLTSFALLMSRTALEIPFITPITYAGLSVSVVSLVISLLIELIVWSKVVKTDTLHLRHTAHVNISLCLLVADCCFLASSYPDGISEIWCRISAVLKHFCYLAMFFWMLSLSTILLHQTVFPFHRLSKKIGIRFSLIMGYVCPFLIVFITFLTSNAGAKDSYFSQKTCWLVYTGMLKGTFFTFFIPVLTIVFFNLFSMAVVIIKLLDHKSTEKTHENEMRAAKTVLRAVIFLTPVFGLPWIFGLFTFSLDLTSGAVTLVVNYAFVVLNSFQGFMILMTTTLLDKMIREALLNSCRKKRAPTTISESSTKLEPIKK